MGGDGAAEVRPKYFTADEVCVVSMSGSWHCPAGLPVCTA